MKKLLSLGLLFSVSASFAMEHAGSSEAVESVSEEKARAYLSEHKPFAHLDGDKRIQKKHYKPSQEAEGEFLDHRNIPGLSLAVLAKKVEEYVTFRRLVNTTSYFGGRSPLKEYVQTIDPDFPPDGATPLVLAAKEASSFDDIAPLVQRATDFSSASDAYGNTAFMLMIENFHLHPGDVHKEYREEMIQKNRRIEELCAKVTDLTVKNDKGSNALMIAIAEHFVSLADRILTTDPTLDPNDVDGKGNGLMHLAIINNDGGNRSDAQETNDIVAWCLQRGLDIDQPNKKGNTPLLVAVAGDKKHASSITAFLLARGADARQKNVRGETALHRALRKGVTQHVRVLEKHDLGLTQIRNYRGETPDMLTLARAVAAIIEGQEDDSDLDSESSSDSESDGSDADSYDGDSERE